MSNDISIVDSSMYSMKFKIIKVSDRKLYDEFTYNVTGLINKLFNNLELGEDKNTITEYLAKFNVDKTIYDYAYKYAQQLYNTNEAAKKRKNAELEEVLKLLKTFEPTTKKERYQKQKLYKKRDRLLKASDSNVCFGGKQLLRDITKLAQKENKTNAENKRLKSKRDEFTLARKHPIYLWGKACEGGNRKVDFFLEDGYLIFKPNKHTKIRVDFNFSGSLQRTEMFKKLIKHIKAKTIAVTVLMYPNDVVLSFDCKKLNGYNFAQSEHKKEVDKEINDNPLKDKTVIRKEVYIKNVTTLKNKMGEDKISQRVAAIDLNPTNIGFSIKDVDSGKIIYTRCYDFSLLTNKEKSTKEKGNKKANPKRIKNLNNKIINEIRHVYVDIFKKIMYYRASKFSMEDLDFNSVVSSDTTEFNRLTKNIWHRELQKNLIMNKCGYYGIELILVSPIYSSFIGNIQNPAYFDSIASSLEIARRGYHKYTKGGGWFPSLSSEDKQKLNYLLNQEVDDNITWVNAYTMLKNLPTFCFGSLFRNEVSDTTGSKLKSSKSKVLTFTK